MTRARALHALTLALLLTLLPKVGFAASPPSFPGYATSGDLGSGGIILSRVSPVVAAPDEPVTLTGVLDVAELGIDLRPSSEPTTERTIEPTIDPTGTGSGSDADPAEAPLASVEVRLGRVPIRSHEDVTAWVSGSSAADGAVLASTDLSRDRSPDAERIPFTITIDDLKAVSAAPYGVLPISLEVRLPERTGPSRALHTFIGYQVRKEYVPLTLSWIVPFTLPADLDLVGELGPTRTAAWEEFIDTLRQRLTAAAATADTVWIIDPALLGAGPAPTSSEGSDPGSGIPLPGPTEPPSDPTSGNATGPEGTSTDEPTQPPTSAEREQALRRDFARDLLNKVAGRDVLLLPRHDADIATLPPVGDDSAGASAIREVLAATLDVTASRRLLSKAGARVLPTLWPADEVWSQERHDAFLDLPTADAAAPWSVLGSAASVTNQIHGPTRTTDGGFVLPVNPALSRRADIATRPTAPATGPNTTTLTTGLALMADTLVTLNDRAGTARQALIALDRDLTSPTAIPELAALLGQVPWLTTGPLTTTAGTARLTPSTPAGTAPSPPLDAPLTPERSQQVTRTLERLPTAANVRIGTGEELATRGVDTLAQLSSLRWRAAPEDWSNAYNPIAEQVAATFTSLSIPPRDITFLADTGSMRVTVENSLDDGIRNAYLSLVVGQPILRIENGPQPVEIGAESRSTVAFEASAIASGSVEVTAVVRAADGTYLSEPTTFTVRVSPTSDWIYWALGGVAIIVIVIGLARMALRPRPLRD